jgi:hypothetical protein
MIGLACLVMARPLQVYLDERDLDQLNAWARERGWTKSQAIRVAVRALTRRPADDPLLELSGDIDGLPAGLSARAGVQPALRALERIDESRSVTIHFPTADDHTAARRRIERLAPRPLTYTDAVSFAVMEATRCGHVLGFDQDFAAAGFDLWQGVG